MLGMLLLMLGNGLQGTLLGVRGGIEQMDSAGLGYVMSAYFIGFLGGSRLAPRLIQRVGHVRVFAALGSTVSAAFILYGAMVDMVSWFFLRLIVGFCFSGIYVVAESWVNDTASNDTRGQSLSLYLMIQMAGIILGQLLLNLADPSGYSLFVLISVLVSLSFAPILLSTSRAPVYNTARPMSIKEAAVNSPLASFGIFMLGGVFSALFAMAPIYATARGFSIAEVSYFIAAIYVGGMLFQYPIGWMSDRYDRRALIVMVTAISSLTATIALLIDHSFYTLVLVALLLGGTSNPLYSLLIAYANDYLEVDQMSAASGALLFINGVGAMGGPVLVGYLMNQFGIEWFFVFIALWMGIICVYGVYRMTQRETEVVGEAGPYMPLTNRVSHIATEIALETWDDEETDSDQATDKKE